MPKTVDLRKLFKKNPQIDLGLLAKAMKAQGDLRRLGLRRPQKRRLASPMERRRALVGKLFSR